MRKQRDEFACVNEHKKRGNIVVLTIAVLAICISGVLCARKLQMDTEYISCNENFSTFFEASA